jgi:hypothetical protein
MKNQRWLAILVAIVGVLLLREGWAAVNGIYALRTLLDMPGSPFKTADDIARAEGYFPGMYLVAVEGLVIGAIAAAIAVGLLMQRLWAQKALVPVSVVLGVYAVAAVVLGPAEWHMQALFAALCAILWWKVWRWRKNGGLRSNNSFEADREA